MYGLAYRFEIGGGGVFQYSNILNKKTTKNLIIP